MCRVGSGEGIGARRAGTTTPCVERAGVDVLERETVVRRRAGFGDLALARLGERFLELFGERFLVLRVRLVECLAGFAALATGRREVRRALPFSLRRDAAFNCFPLLWFRDPGM